MPLLDDDPTLRAPDRLVVEWADTAPLRGDWRGVGRYTFVDGDAAELARLRADPAVRTAYRAWAPVPPPEDLDPETPDLVDDQAWLDEAGGFGFGDWRDWPGADGANVTVGDVEYAWEDEHEDLPGDVDAWGTPYPDYAYHGSSVLGMLAAPQNGYGVDGAVLAADLVVFHPMTAAGDYDVAGAIAEATRTLVPGDVLLIEQQGYADGTYCPASVDPAVWDAIAAAVDAGIVVVEPAGNGAADLDDPSWEAVFSRDHDPGSILVGGADPADGAWAGSSYGGRIDVAGWYGDIATTTSQGGYADLWSAGGDSRQMYTASFGGTSGASAQVAALAAVLQSVAIETREAPLTPRELRALLVSTAAPGLDDSWDVGGLPDLRRVLRTTFLP